MSIGVADDSGYGAKARCSVSINAYTCAMIRLPRILRALDGHAGGAESGRSALCVGCHLAACREPAASLASSTDSCEGILCRIDSSPITARLPARIQPAGCIASFIEDRHARCIT